MSWIQAQEELNYNRDDSAYLDVLRQEAFDPWQFFADCEEHGTSFDIREEGCPEYHAPYVLEEPSPWASSEGESTVWVTPEGEPPF